jgi:hypothetical protein
LEPDDNIYDHIKAMTQVENRREYEKSDIDMGILDRGFVWLNDTQLDDMQAWAKKRQNYSTRDSHVVTHHSTNLAIQCLNMAERTGSLAFTVL